MAFEKALRYVVLAGVFALPFLALYVASSLFFPFITGKNFAFRIIVEIVTGVWIALALVNPAYRPRHSWLLWGFAAFIVIMGVADLFGAYPFKSFWSNYERMEGWVLLAHLFAYFLVAVSMLNTERLWKWWWHVSLGVSVIVGCIGLFQLGGLVGINQGDVRLDARLGNSTYLGVYMLFHIFMAALLWARAWVEKKGERVLYASLYGGIIALDAFILFFTATRGAILGLLGGALLAAFLLIAIAPRSRVAWRMGVLIIGFFMLAGSFWVVRDAAWVQRVEPLYRLATLLDGTVQSRFMNWGMAWEGFKERPILGWGQENYAAVFDKYYNPGMYAQEQWFDRVHNIIFDWLIAGGILGLLAYLSLYFFALLAVWRSGAFAPYERALLTGLFAGYFFYLLFTFDNLTSYILFVAVLAYIAVRAAAVMPPSLKAPMEPLSRSSLPFLVAIVVVVVGGVAWYTNASMIAANRTLIQAISPQAEGPAKNLQLFKEALAYPRAGHQEIREQLSQTAISAVGATNLPEDLKREFVETAAQELDAQAMEAPLNARGPFFLGILLDRAGALTEGKAALDEAHARSPKKQSILFEMGLNAYARGAQEESLGYFQEAYELEPTYADARLYYAAALIRTSKDAEAEEILQPIVASGQAADERVAAAYIEQNRFDKVAALWEARVAAYPQDAEAWAVLARAYYQAGEVARALQILEDLKRDIPSVAAQADALIQQIEAAAE